MVAGVFKCQSLRPTVVSLLIVLNAQCLMKQTVLKNYLILKQLFICVLRGSFKGNCICCYGIYINSTNVCNDMFGQIHNQFLKCSIMSSQPTLFYIEVFIIKCYIIKKLICIVQLLISTL